MKRDSDTGISFFQRYLTVWVIICMVLGILMGSICPAFQHFLISLNMPRCPSLWQY